MWSVFMWLCVVAFSVPELIISDEVMYVGMENTIGIRLNGADPEDVSIKVSLGTLRKMNDSTYVYIPQSGEEDIKIKLYHKKIVCDIRTVTVQDLPTPSAVFENETNGILKRKDLSNPGALKLVYDDVKSGGPVVPVYQFSCIISDSEGRFLFSRNVRGEAFDERSLQEIRRLKNVGQIVISNVMIKSMQGVRRLELSRTIAVTD